MIINQCIFNCLFLRFCNKCVSPIKSFEKIVSRFCALLWIEFFLVLEFIQFLEDFSLYWGVILRFSWIFRCWGPGPECVVVLLGFIRSEKSGSPCGIILRIAISAGLMCLDYSGVSTDNSAICVCFLIRYGDSVVLITLTAILLSNTVDIE